MEPISRMLVLVGSGPGIGVAVASRFVEGGFDRVALLARNEQRLEDDRKTVLAAATSADREIVVGTWTVDISDLDRMEHALSEIEDFGRLECLYFNAARVGTSLFFDFPVKDIEEDFRVSNLALYVTARWAIPLLLRNPQSSSPADWKPSLFVTSSLLPLDPIPELFALSMVKAAQANLVKSLHKTFSSRGVHVGLVVVGGAVSPDAPALNPRNIAEQAWKLYAQKLGGWGTQVTIYEDGKVDSSRVI